MQDQGFMVSLRNHNSSSPLLAAPDLNYLTTEQLNYLVSKLVFDQHTERWAGPKLKYGKPAWTY